MLILRRKKNEKILIGDNITLMVTGINGDSVAIGIDAPRDMPVHREEVAKAIKKAGEQLSPGLAPVSERTK